MDFTLMGNLSLTTRIRIFERDGYACVYCGRRRPEVVLEVDHIVPRVSGGTNDSTNLVTACRQCNSGKRANPIGLPAGVVIQALPQLNHRMARRTRMGQSNHPAAMVAVADPAMAAIEAPRARSQSRAPIGAPCRWCGMSSDDGVLVWVWYDGRPGGAHWCTDCASRYVAR